MIEEVIMNYKFNINPSKEEIEDFHKGLREYNLKFINRDFLAFQITVKNDDGVVIAGIDGESFWGKINIDNLWVHSDYRNNDLGTKLIKLAEEEAIKRNCTGIILDTMSFQAEEFYLKLGFRRFGIVENYNNQCSKIFLTKDL